MQQREAMVCINLSSMDETVMSSVNDISKPGDVAFILYTSGSTGKPKGIALTNINIALQIASVYESLPFGPDIVALQQSGLGFDAAIFQLLIALCNGGRVVVGDNRGDPAELAQLIVDEKVTFTLGIVSEVLALLRYGHEQLKRASSWRIALVGGEQFKPQLAAQFASLQLPELRLFNAYGPTEASIMASIGEVAYTDPSVAEKAQVSIGKVSCPLA